MISGHPRQFGNHNLNHTVGKNKTLRLGEKVPFCSLPLFSHLQGLFPLFFFFLDVLEEGGVGNFGHSLETLEGVSGKAKGPQTSRRKLGDHSQTSPPCGCYHPALTGHQLHSGQLLPSPQMFLLPSRCRSQMCLSKIHFACVPPLLSILQRLPVASSRKSNFLPSDSAPPSSGSGPSSPGHLPGSEGGRAREYHPWALPSRE